MKKIINKFLILSIVIAIFSSCESTNMDLLNDPGELNPESANPDYILNSILVGTNIQNMNLNGLTAGIVRQVNMFSTYNNNISVNSMNGAWITTYLALNNKNLLESIASEKNLTHHVAIAKIMEATQMINLVDYIGTATLSQAANPDVYPTPGLDSGEYIYSEMLTLLEEAKSELQLSASYTPNDFYYGGDLNKWEKYANSLIIKMLVQERKSANFDAATAATTINNIVSSGKYISNFQDDFQYNYATNDVNPDARHPFFIGNYLSGANGYMSNDFMKRLLYFKSNEDPRLKQYIYRQTADAPTGVFIDDCITGGGGADCYVGFGYWGRIHADETGIPNDNLLRATYGAYPAGGALDTDAPVNVLDAGNMGGAGINPMLTASTIHFLLAEAILTIPGVNGNAKDEVVLGIENSFNKVQDFTGTTFDPTNVAAYITEVSNNFSSADAEGKLAIAVEESYIAGFGNSINAYNSYRRTGYPAFGVSFQNPGAFPRSMYLPKSEIDSNDNPDFVQKQITDQVFWDTNPAGFIN